MFYLYEAIYDNKLSDVIFSRLNCNFLEKWIAYEVY